MKIYTLHATYYKDGEMIDNYQVRVAKTKKAIMKDMYTMLLNDLEEICKNVCQKSDETDFENDIAHFKEDYEKDQENIQMFESYDAIISDYDIFYYDTYELDVTELK